ncbi:SusD/RagB family nutrient-binding outer membrane lipoprotein [Carboxylicivirga sp. M1479]|uniref:SusD/RagB family nutrient-binding outer membrane lipoprotein n=1 Tax=Carboxylicivirga sp. M1479 TaxID=2594476 RepID=UPI001178A689|nr:SusD/RagB family nutrient-binding outer membrane lipoprotein [Carboxylicivirga sp. M1479]TRX70989.1 SusD/RagB family nutrient-binding outer membrane lipoprotein [Carboxylicivirga sp. M1479]
MKRIFIFLFSIVLLSTSCETIDFGDTNENINGPVTPSTSSLMSGAMTNFATRTGRPYRITPTLNVQYLMQHVYNDEMLYANTSGYWTSYYVQTLSNLQAVINTCSDEELSADPFVIANGAPENQLAVAMIFKSVIFKRVTDLFGDVPYSEALNSEIISPKYDSQEDIYKGMIADVKAARDMIDGSKEGPTGDVIYNGDMDKWAKFANSFILSLSIQLSEVYPGVNDYAATEFKAAVANPNGLIELAADEAIYTYDIANGYDNPWNWMRAADYGVTKEFLDAMKGNGFTSNSTYDDRIALFAKDPSLEGHPYGYDTNTEGENSPVNPIIIGSDTKLPLLTAAYTFLNRAEGAALGWTTEDVADMLTSGIESSFATGSSLYDSENELMIGDGSAYAAARVLDLSSAAGGAIQVIAEEKWVALFPLGFDAWSEWRRTDYPMLSPAPDAINDGQIPRRYNYPSTEVTLNADGYATGVAALTPARDNNTSRMWWDK